LSEWGRQVTKEELDDALLPPPNAPWSRITPFALTFDGYARWRTGRCGTIANAAVRAYHATGDLPGSLTVLRTCLFFEQRRYHHFGTPPDDRSMAYIHAVVERIRSLVAAQRAGGQPMAKPDVQRTIRTE
jgi:hypothetical protein